VIGLCAGCLIALKLTSCNICSKVSFISWSGKLRITSQDKHVSMHAPRFGTQSKQSSKQLFLREIKVSRRRDVKNLKQPRSMSAKMAANGIRTHARTNQRHTLADEHRCWYPLVLAVLPDVFWSTGRGGTPWWPNHLVCSFISQAASARRQRSYLCGLRVK